MFEHHIISPIPSSVQNIKIQQDKSAMHGAIILSFSADEKDLKQIIQNNNLVKQNDLPEVINGVLSQFDKIEWWRPTTELKGMTIFGKIIEKEYEWEALFLFTDKDNQVYGVKI